MQVLMLVHFYIPGNLYHVHPAYTRFMANYGMLEYDDAVYALATGSRSYSVDSFGVRAQVDF